MESSWIVTQGEYSDYRVMCVCPSEDEARRVAERVGGDVEEVPLASLADVHTASVLTMSCTVEATTGQVFFESVRARLVHEFGEDPDEPAVIASVGDAPRHRYSFQGPSVIGFEVVVYGTDHERVRKSYSERKAKARARAMDMAESIDDSRA